MALEGSLREFGLADILQLISLQRKTGSLTVESRLDRVRIVFHEGHITGAESKKKGDEHRLGNVLVKKGLVTEEQLKNALEEQKSRGGKLGHILLAHEAVGKEELESVLTFFITEIITNLFSWKEGRYEFKPEGIPLDKIIDLEIDTQHLLMEGMRILDEWAIVEGKISLDSILEKTGKLPSELDDNERAIYALVDGQTDASGIADLGGLEHMQTTKIMLKLMEEGYVELKAAPALATSPETLRKTPQEIEQAHELTQRIYAAVVMTFVLASIFVSVFYFKGWEAETADIAASEQAYKIGFRIQAYKYQNGIYPPTLSLLPQDTKDPWGNQFNYSFDDNTFVLFSSGPDGAPGTPDDIY